MILFHYQSRISSTKPKNSTQSHVTCQKQRRRNMTTTKPASLSLSQLADWLHWFPRHSSPSHDWVVGFSHIQRFLAVITEQFLYVQSRPSVDIQNPVVFVLLDCLRYCSPKVEFIPDRTLLWFVIPLQSLSASHNKTPRLCELNSEPLTPSALLLWLSSVLWWTSVKRWKSKQCLCHSSSKALRVVFVVIKDPQLKLQFKILM